MEENKLTHRAGLVREAAEILNRYTPYAAERRVTFQTAENGWLTARQRGRRVSVSCIFFPKFSLEMVAMYAKIRYTIPTTAGERSLSRPREI